MPDFTVGMQEILNISDYEKAILHIEENYGIKLEQDDFPKFNLYNFVEFYINEFSVENKRIQLLLFRYESWAKKTHQIF